MAFISRKTVVRAAAVALFSAAVSVGIAAATVPILGGTYDGLGMWLSLLLPLGIAFPMSAWQFHQSEALRQARDELAAMHIELDSVHSALKQAHEALRHKARHDGMTGGLLREAFLDDLRAASVAGRSGALLLADADHFKRINDSFGHQTGDEALLAIAKAISGTIGINDFWGRIGGEEFAIFLDGGSPEEALAVAETIRRTAEATDIRRETGRVPVTISIGGICVAVGFNLRQAIADADRRLYRAKRSGRNIVILDEPDGGDASAA
jgi:diguanylate cyclase (GGDEF)-like protein